MITKPQRRQPEQTHIKLLQMSGDVHPNPGPATKYPCPVCTGNVTSRGVSYKFTKCYGWVHAKCSGILNAAQYRRKSYWTCDACSSPQSQQSPPPTRSPTPPTKQIRDNSTFNVLQLNANGIGNKLTELEVALERNMVKVAVIQESKLSPKSKNPCIQNYTTVRKVRSHGQGRGLLIFIHRSITFSKQPSTPDSLSDPHLEELTIKAELGNTKLIISNVYIPTASSCSNGCHSSIEHLLTTPDTLILGDFNAHHPAWYSRSTDTRGRKMADKSKRSLPTDCQRDEKIIHTVLLKAASHHIPTGHNRLHEEPVPAEILDVMNRRDDLRKRDPASPELPRLNKSIQNRICVHKRQK